MTFLEYTETNGGLILHFVRLDQLSAGQTSVVGMRMCNLGFHPLGLS
jgi:hypothetical protein